MTTTLAPSARQNRTIQVSLSAAGPARGLLLSALFALFLPAFAALAEAPVPSVPSAVPGQPHTYYPQGLPAQAAEPAPAASLLPPLSVTEHTLRLAGGDLRYTAKAGPLPLRDGKGETLAEIFHVAYVREPQDPKRPITFVFNGGPGAASAYLHLGAMGPKAIAASDKGEVLGPPPRLSDNESTWLPFTDLVFVDPVGTGYSRVGARKEEKDFFGVEQDTEALADFIRLYLIDAGRVASPVFVAGESYGGFRAATITRQLQKTGGVSPSGIVLISPALEFSLLHADDYDPLPWALSLPSFAAVNLEKKGVAGREALAEGLKEAQRYALSDYLVALASGVEEGGKTASETVARLTGLPLPLVERHHARIFPSLFIKEFDRVNGRVLSRYDGGVSGPDPHPSSQWPRGPDPVLDATVPLWTAAFVLYAQEYLGYKTDQAYRLLNREVRPKWDFGTSPTRQGYAGALDDIQAARSANRALEVFIGTGYSDLITPYSVPSYLVRQLAPLDGARPITVEGYAGGHMLYLRPESRRALKEDVEAMYMRALKALPQG
jgi:carboxypeptidase C (cathepsin A)